MEQFLISFLYNNHNNDVCSKVVPQSNGGFFEKINTAILEWNLSIPATFS